MSQKQKPEHRHYSADQKAAIVRRHLADKAVRISVSNEAPAGCCATSPGGNSADGNAAVLAALGLAATITRQQRKRAFNKR